MEEEILFGKGEKNTFNEQFTGQTYLNILSILGEVMVANVTFESGCRTKWHVLHADENGGHIILITNGEGWYQEEGHDARKLKRGDVVAIPANVKHWHGATKDSEFTQRVIEVPGKNQDIELFEDVSDEEYNNLK